MAKGRCRLGRRRFAHGSLLTNNHFQEPLQDVFERLIQAEADRLPGRGIAGMRLDLGSQVVATGRSLKTFSAEGCEQTEDVNFSGRSFGEFQVFGRLAEVGFCEEHRADGKLLGEGSRRCWIRCFFDISLDNSIYTIKMAAKINLWDTK